MRNWVFTYEHKDHEHEQTIIVDPDTGRVNGTAFTTWQETVRPLPRRRRGQYALAA